MFVYKEKGFMIFISFIFIFLILNITLFILLLILYIINNTKLKYIKLEIPEKIYITGIKSFNFIYSSEKVPYKQTISNLGNTGKLYYDCYQGTCYKNCDYEALSLLTSNQNLNLRNLSECNETELNFDCSQDCAINHGTHCNSCYFNYLSSEGNCTYNESVEYLPGKYCYANNLILKWKGYLYNSENATEYMKYSYLNFSFLPDENCPNNLKMCGILDNEGNKLCLPEKEECPINKIELSKPTDGYNYKETSLGDIKIYYTNEATQTGKIVEGLYADSDLKIQYKDGCEILDKGPIDSFILDNEKIYVNSSVSDPYKDKSINSKGYSYLKWCIPGHDQERNLTSIRRNYRKYIYNRYVNNTFISGILSQFNKKYSLNLFAIIYLFVVLIGILIAKFSDMFNGSLCNWFQENTNDIKSFSLILAPFLVLSIFCLINCFSINSYLASIRDNYIRKELINSEYFDINNFYSVISLNIAFITIFFIFLGCILCFYILYIVYAIKLKKNLQKEKTDSKNEDKEKNEMKKNQENIEEYNINDEPLVDNLQQNEENIINTGVELK